MKKTIGRWEFNDWDGAWLPEVRSPIVDLSFDKDNDLCVEIRCIDSGTENAYIPIEIMIEFFKMIGYEVKKK